MSRRITCGHFNRKNARTQTAAFARFARHDEDVRFNAVLLLMRPRVSKRPGDLAEFALNATAGSCCNPEHLTWGDKVSSTYVKRL
jgi:hypothetical protein